MRDRDRARQSVAERGRERETEAEVVALCFRVVRSSVRPSVRSPKYLPSFHLYMSPLVHPTNRYHFTERFPGICRRTHKGNGLKFYMVMYLDHLQNWFDYGHGLLIFLSLTPLWLSETGQIWGFRAFPGERMNGKPQILQADVAWSPSELITSWLRSVDFPLFEANLT